MKTGIRALCLIAAWAGFAMSLATPAMAACRVAATPTLPMPAWTWLRSWRADLVAPGRLASGGDGRVWIADPSRGRVVARHADGSVAAVHGELGRPTSLALTPQGGTLVGDAARGRVTHYDADWHPGFALGVGDGEFGHPGDIAVDPVNGDTYVSDTARHVIKVYSAAGLPVRTIGSPAPANDSPAADGQLRTPTGIVLAGNELLVADQLNYRVQAFDKASGAFLYCIGTYQSRSFVPTTGGPSRTFGMAQGLWVDSLGRLYVVDAFQGQVGVFDRNAGAMIGVIGVFGNQPGALRSPSDLVIDRHGRLFVTNTDHARLEAYGLDAFTDPEAFAPATARADPRRIDRNEPPAGVDFSVEVPGYRLIDLDPASLQVNGLPAAVVAADAGDRDGDGWPELVLRVGGSALLATVPNGQDSVLAMVSGRIGALGIAAQASLELFTSVRDGDGDGVPDAADACPGSAPGDPVDPAGCTIEQSCPCGGPLTGGAWPAKSAYVQCVRASAEVLVALGRLDRERLGAKVGQAASSACGRKP